MGWVGRCGYGGADGSLPPQGLVCLWGGSQMLWGPQDGETQLYIQPGREEGGDPSPWAVGRGALSEGNPGRC